MGGIFRVRPFKDSDYKEFSRWWGVDGSNPPPKDTLPPTGVVINENESIGFLADTDTSVMIMTWWHANPDNTPKQTHQALSYMVECMRYIAENRGKKYIFCYTSVRGMMRLLERHGFRNIDGHMILEI